MPVETEATEADEVVDEHLEDEAGDDESSTEEDGNLDELLGQLHDGAPLDSEFEEEGEEDSVD